jgi:hypothetical protein
MDQSVRLCVVCETRPRRNAHANTKYCTACQQALLHQPPSRVTPAQAAAIQRLCGTMTRTAIAQQLGLSHAKVQRFLREQGLRSNARDYPPEVVEAVAQVYESAPPGQGKRTIEQLFPAVVVRSIVERRQHHRPVYQPRQVRWQGEQLLDAVRMAGLVSHHAQARYFGRPNAYAGSITSLWQKHFRCPPRDVHGLPLHLSWLVATPGVPAVLVKHQQVAGPAAKVLWLDLVGWLREDLDPTIRDAVEVLAQFQRWLFHTSSSDDIRRMITERETTYGDDWHRNDERTDPGPPRARRGTAV